MRIINYKLIKSIVQPIAPSNFYLIFRYLYSLFHTSHLKPHTLKFLCTSYFVPRTFITLAFFCSSFFAYSQPDTCHLRLSLLTCSPGEELYSAWGHTAIRVTDRNTGSDMVFNYGTFDDTDPDFYLKFTKGIMHYALSVYPYSDFLQEYQYQNRGIVEQELRLSCAQKGNIYRALQVNNTNENRFYYYYFHTDNCTTRAQDLIVENTGSTVSYKNILPHRSVTFRNLIHSYLDNSHQYWSKFGIDLFLGLNLDKKPTNEEAMFLPDYLKRGFDSATIDRHPLVSRSEVVLKWPDNSVHSGSWFSPLLAFTLLLIIVGLISLSKIRSKQKLLAIFDGVFFFSIGILGILMLVLWLIRVDTVCRNNLNLLWALPTHAIAAFFVNSKRKWVQSYFQVVFWISIVLAFTWFFIPQQINNAVGPLLLLIIIRSYYHSKKPA